MMRLLYTTVRCEQELYGGVNLLLFCGLGEIEALLTRHLYFYFPWFLVYDRVIKESCVPRQSFMVHPWPFLWSWAFYWLREWIVAAAYMAVLIAEDPHVLPAWEGVVE